MHFYDTEPPPDLRIIKADLSIQITDLSPTQNIIINLEPGCAAKTASRYSARTLSYAARGSFLSNAYRRYFILPLWRVILSNRHGSLFRTDVHFILLFPAFGHFILCEQVRSFYLTRKRSKGTFSLIAFSSLRPFEVWFNSFFCLLSGINSPKIGPWTNASSPLQKAAVYRLNMRQKRRLLPVID